MSGYLKRYQAPPKQPDTLTCVSDPFEILVNFLIIMLVCVSIVGVFSKRPDKIARKVLSICIDVLCTYILLYAMHVYACM